MIEELKHSTMADIIQGVLKWGHHIKTNKNSKIFVENVACQRCNAMKAVFNC